MQEATNEQWVPNPDFLSLWRTKLRAAVRKLKERRLGSRIDTSDLVQDAMLQVWKDIGSFRGTTEQEFDAWIKSIAAGHARNASRRHHAKKRDIGTEVPGVTAFLSKGSTPSDIVEQSESYQRMARAIEQLESRKQFVVLQHAFERRTFIDIGKDLDRTAETVSRIFEESLLELKRLLDEGMDSE